MTIKSCTEIIYTFLFGVHLFGLHFVLLGISMALRPQISCFLFCFVMLGLESRVNHTSFIRWLPVKFCQRDTRERLLPLLLPVFVSITPPAFPHTGNDIWLVLSSTYITSFITFPQIPTPSD